MPSPALQPEVLVIRGGAIGDFILTLPAIRLLRETLPQARLEILGYPAVIELALAAGLADGMRSLEHGSMAKLFVPGAVLDEALAGYFRRFNLVVSYLFDPDGIFRGNMAGLGVKTYLEVPHRIQPGLGHAAEQLARPLEKLAMFLSNPAPRLDIKSSSTAVPANTLAFHPGSGSLKKNWPMDRWVRLVRNIREDRPTLRLALITGEAEADRGITAAFLSACSGIELLHWDQLALTELAARLAGCAGFMGHDSGISHLAAATGLPSLLLFGPTDPALWAPRNPGVRVLRSPGPDLTELDFDKMQAAFTEWRPKPP